MKRGLVAFIEGSVDVKVPPESRESAMTLLMRGAFDSSCVRTAPDGSLRFRLPRRSRDAFLCECCGAEELREYGLPRLLGLYRKRLGLLVGFALMVAALLISDDFVWCVRVSGADSLTDADVVAALARVGFGEGTRISSVDFDELHNEILLAAPEIAWLSVNMRGTVANVEVREVRRSVLPEGEGFANVVASSDAQIISVIPYSGRALVGAGDTVRKGELLISGVVESELAGTRYCRADGRVDAYTHRTLTVSVPLEREVKAFTGELYSDKYVIFLGERIKISINSGNLGAEYGKIEGKQSDITVRSTPLVLAGCVELPLTLETETRAVFRTETVELDAETAVDEAFRRLGAEIIALSESADIVRREASAVISDGAVRLVCELDCAEDIALPQPFTVNY